jgi:dihydroorotase
MFQILLKNGLIIDPSQKISKICSVAVHDGKIAAIGKDISEAKAEKVFNMEGKIITPGLIDIHCHPSEGMVPGACPPDEIGINRGVTTLCDAGSAGAANFWTMRRYIIEPAKTDILCFLHLATTGLVTLPDDELWDEHDINLDYSKQVVEANRDIIKGIKIRVIQSLAQGLGMKGIEIAKKLSNDVNLPLMMHVGSGGNRIPGDPMDDFSRAAVSLLEEGDILSHYLTWEPGGLILKDGTVYPELEAAKKRGVVLDSSHASRHFSFTIARHAIAKGLLPTVISTDMTYIGLPVVQSLPVVMSKFINLGLALDQVIEMTTFNPAKALGEENKRGSLKPGMVADITVMELKKGDYIFGDGRGGEMIHGEALLEPSMVFKAGKVMPAYSGYHIPPVYT